MTTETIDISMNWEQTLPLLLILVQDGDYEGRVFANQQLKKMAWLADCAFKPLEIGIYPMRILPTGEYTLAQTEDEIDHYDVDVRHEGTDPIFEREHLTEEEADRLVVELEVKFPQAGINDLRELL